MNQSSMATEPARIIGSLIVLVQAVCVALTAWGVYEVSQEQQDATVKALTALGGMLSVAIPIVQAEWTRRKVYAPETVSEIVQDTEIEAKADGVQAGIKMANAQMLIKQNGTTPLTFSPN